MKDVTFVASDDLTHVQRTQTSGPELQSLGTVGWNPSAPKSPVSKKTQTFKKQKKWIFSDFQDATATILMIFMTEIF